MHRRLKILLDQNYIGRNYDASYRLSNRPASYFLDVKGINALKQSKAGKYTTSVLKNIYNDRDASKRFVKHWLEVFSLYCSLKARFGEDLRFFSKSEIAGFEYFPKTRPDGFIRLKRGNRERHYILEVLDSTQPFFVQVNMIKKYIEYSEEGDWEEATGTELPIVILVCGSSAQQRKLLRFAETGIDDFDADDGAIIITTRTELGNELTRF